MKVLPKRIKFHDIPVDLFNGFWCFFLFFLKIGQESIDKLEKDRIEAELEYEAKTEQLTKTIQSLDHAISVLRDRENRDKENKEKEVPKHINKPIQSRAVRKRSPRGLLSLFTWLFPEDEDGANQNKEEEEEDGFFSKLSDALTFFGDDKGDDAKQQGQQSEASEPAALSEVSGTPKSVVADASKEFLPPISENEVLPSAMRSPQNSATAQSAFSPKDGMQKKTPPAFSEGSFGSLSDSGEHRQPALSVTSVASVVPSESSVNELKASELSPKDGDRSDDEGLTSSRLLRTMTFGLIRTTSQSGMVGPSDDKKEANSDDEESGIDQVLGAVTFGLLKRNSPEMPRRSRIQLASSSPQSPHSPGANPSTPSPTSAHGNESETPKPQHASEEAEEESDIFETLSFGLIKTPRKK
jgi:hypothetical protein